MNHVAELLEQCSQIVQQHVPPGAIPPWWFASGVGLLVGIALCVLGAKLARWFIVVALAGVGVAGGVAADAHIGVSPLATALVGGLIGGGVGYFLHRVWVGLFAGAFLAVVVLGVYSSQTVIPRLVEFDHASQAEVADFHVGPGYDQPQIDWEHFNDFSSRFRDYLRAKAPNVQRYATLWALGAGVGGFVLGAVFSRLILIVFTSACGSLLVAGGVTLLAQGFGLDIYQTYAQRPKISVVALALFFVVSVALQVMLTRSGGQASTPHHEADD